jgi:TPR repeat protein
MSDAQFNSNSINSSIFNNSLHDIFQTIKNFNKINIKEIEPTTKNINKNIFEGDLSIVINELVDLIFGKLNEGKNEKIIKKCILNYIDNNKIIFQEIFYYLLNNQNKSNSIYLLGYFNYNGIEININKQGAIELYQKAAGLQNRAAQLNLSIIYIYDSNGLAFELSNELAEEEYSSGISNLGICYEIGIGTYTNEQKAFELYQKAADLGNVGGIINLGCCYYEGIGTDINKKKAFGLYQKAADLGNVEGINKLGLCYNKGVGTDVNKQKAFELFQIAANLECEFAQYNLALMYENGDGIKKDTDQAIYWYNKSAEQGHKYSQDKLNELLKK